MRQLSQMYQDKLSFHFYSFSKIYICVLYMSGLEVNKILASIILAIILVILIGFLGDIIIDREKNDLTKNAYHIDVTDLSANNTSISLENDLESEPISMFLANASLNWSSA